MSEQKNPGPESRRFQLKETSPARAYRAVRAAVADDATQWEITYQRAKKAYQQYRTKRATSSRGGNR